jgi:hypothetical protein
LTEDRIRIMDNEVGFEFTNGTIRTIEGEGSLKTGPGETSWWRRR